MVQADNYEKIKLASQAQMAEGKELTQTSFYLAVRNNLVEIEADDKSKFSPMGLLNPWESLLYGLASTATCPEFNAQNVVVMAESNGLSHDDTAQLFSVCGILLDERGRTAQKRMEELKTKRGK